MAANDSQQQPNTENHKPNIVTVDGRSRRYLLHLPPGYSDADPIPLVLAFHGGGTNAEAMVEFSGIANKADTAGFAVAFPDGSGRVPHARTFNAGNCCGHASRHNVDDVAFVSVMLDDIASRINLDAARVYATGMSNGAMMCYRIASELSQRIAAIAPVAGGMAMDECTPTSPVAVCHFHGTADEFAPYEGGRGRKSLSRVDFHSVRFAVNAWVKANDCSSECSEQKLPASQNDGTHVTQRIWRNQEGVPMVVLYVIHNGGHTWPGRESSYNMLGKTTMNLNANDVMWDFFRTKTRGDG